jgi:Spy/CpxP family protein refolding chaperone
MREHAHDVAELVVEHVDASPEQEARLEQLLDPLVPDLLALRPERQALMAELQEVLGAPDVDPVRVEEIRKKALALADRASARGAKALVDAAQVLDQGQRSKLIRHWQRRHGA